MKGFSNLSAIICNLTNVLVSQHMVLIVLHYYFLFYCDFPGIDLKLKCIAIFYIRYFVSDDFDQRRVLEVSFLGLRMRKIYPPCIFLPLKFDSAA